MKPTLNPNKNVTIGNGKVIAVQTRQHPVVYVAPGGASTLSREKAERWARFINERMPTQEEEE